METQEQRIISQAIIQRLDILIQENQKIIEILLKIEQENGEDEENEEDDEEEKESVNTKEQKQTLKNVKTRVRPKEE